MDNNDQVLEATNSNEDQDLELNLDSGENAETLKAQLEEANKKLENFNNVVARAKKAEEELKQFKSNKVDTPTGISRQETEELILKTQGVDDKRMELLRTISKGKGVSLTDAMADELYTVFDEKLKNDEKAQKASLSASRGSAKKEAEKTTNLTRDEHREKWEKMTGLKG